jgi:hypothetical protein
MTDKEYLKEFWKENPQTKESLFVSGTVARKVLGFTNTAQLFPLVDKGVIRAKDFGTGDRPRNMYHINDVFSLWLEEKKELV